MLLTPVALLVANANQCQHQWLLWKSLLVFREIETPSELPSQFAFFPATPPTAAIFEPTDFFVERAALFFASKSLIFL